MAVSLLSTKLHAPVLRAQIIRRPRLFHLLNAGLDRKLILVSAPAGFGKSTLISSWLSGRRWPAAWISLDEDDNELNRFLLYLVGGLRQIEPGAFSKLWGLLQSTSVPPPDVLLQYFINEVGGLKQDSILVLDDYHKITQAEIHESLAFLLANTPRFLHLVIASRKDLPFSVANLRAQNELVELHEKELRFDACEALLFFEETMGVELEQDQAILLTERTEGWIVGLQLAGLTIKDRDNAAEVVNGFSGDNRYVGDYLMDEVLARQPQVVQDFLLRTALLDRFSAQLCDWLLERNDSQAVLEALERAHLFIIPLDEHREWYRYHHLFSELLVHRLMRKDPQALPILNTRASIWYEERAAYRDAVRFALAAEDFERAANLIEYAGFSILWHGGWHTLSRWFEILPASFIRSRARLWYIYLWTLVNLGRLDSVNKVISWLQLETGDPEDPSQELSVEAQANLAVIRGVYSMHCQANIPQAQSLICQGLQLIPESSIDYYQIASINCGYAGLLAGEIPKARQALTRSAHLGLLNNNPMTILYANINQAELAALEGHYHAAASLFQDAFHYAHENGLEESLPFSKANTGLGNIFSEWNDLEAAVQYLKEGLRLAERSKYVDFVIPAYSDMMRLYCERKQMNRAGEIVELANTFTQKNGQPAFAINRVAALQARLALIDERISAAERFLKEADITELNKVCYHKEYELITLAKVWTAGGKLSQAEKLLESLVSLARLEGRVRSLIAIQCLLAKTYFLHGDLEKACQTLQNALELAEPEGFLRTFLDEGEPMAALLYTFAQRAFLSRGAQSVSHTYLSGLISAIRIETGRNFVPHLPEHTIDPSELTERELEILDLVAAGLSNQEIAAELVVAVSTVKWHLKNIFSKLDVSRRIQAVKVARRFELIS